MDKKKLVPLASQHAMETINVVSLILITFKHLQNKHPHIHDRLGDIVHAAIGVITKGVWSSEKTRTFHLEDSTQSSCFSFLIFPLCRSISRCRRSISFLWWSISS